jgi:hypothetical protein
MKFNLENISKPSVDQNVKKKVCVSPVLSKLNQLELKLQ